MHACHKFFTRLAALTGAGTLGTGHYLSPGGGGWGEVGGFCFFFL